MRCPGPVASSISAPVPGGDETYVKRFARGPFSMGESEQAAAVVFRERLVARPEEGTIAIDLYLGS